jgi:DNA-binding response OmpR family regulator
MMPLRSGGKDLASRVEIPPRVLVVDDESLVRWSLTTGLRAAGFDAVAAADGNEARALARQFPPPDVVLLDAHLWDGNPRQLLDDIQALAPRCRFLILVVPGRDAVLPRWENVDIIMKPFDLPAVIHTVEVAVKHPPLSGQIAV